MKNAGLVVLFCVLGAAAGITPEETVSFWKDSGFQKSFMGSYGIRTEIEPAVTTVERGQMEKVMQLMGEETTAEKAVELLRKAMAMEASSALFDFTLANLMFQRDKLEEASAAYAAAVKKFPSFQRAHKNAGLVFIRRGDFEAAALSLTRAVELGAADGFTFGLLGYAYGSSGQFSSAETAYRMAVMLQPGNMDWKLGLCRTLFRQERFADAVALCSELLKRDPSKKDFWLLEANAWLGLKQPLKAAEIYEMLAASGDLPAAASYTLGDIYLNENLPDRAAAVYGEALKQETQPDLPRHLRNAEVLLSRNAGPAAAVLLTLVKQKYPKASEEDRRRMLKLEARMAAASNESVEVQNRILEEIVALDPLDGEALILLGQNAAASGNVEKAVFYFERAAGIERSEADAKLRHGQVLVRNGRYADALPLLKRAQELNPRDDVTRYVEQVERVARSRVN